MTITAERPAAPAGSAASLPATAGTVRRGRNRIASKALNRVVAAVTAEALGVSASKVGVDLADSRGLLALTVSTPIRVVALSRVEREPSSVIRSGGPILDRVAAAQETIRTRVQQLTGSSIARVTVKVTGIDIRTEERVA
ncbi:hypothetical protein [Herbiconiux flava]|uniref:Putative alkaline shock family protein YloU n=1 Tax=Herbiconiux flava TaxID=881268 RepID=A0A852STP8_9MICO|nr:hypothetical protein [Herbiconiux flava]NYD72237.1 putative alkaline shock family protein YloU [Herbiconiux flava]GLK17799.1 hypothetical protein GCM10017602_22810 [Herbiconiux flava]